jgi:transposase
MTRIGLAKMTEHTIGIDISRSCIDAFRLPDEATQRFENTSCGLRALIKWLGTSPVARIVYEPTGPYHRAFEETLSGTFPGCVSKVVEILRRRPPSGLSCA